MEVARPGGRWTGPHFGLSVTWKAGSSSRTSGPRQQWGSRGPPPPPMSYAATKIPHSIVSGKEKSQNKIGRCNHNICVPGAHAQFQITNTSGRKVTRGEERNVPSIVAITFIRLLEEDDDKNQRVGQGRTIDGCCCWGAH